MSATRKSPVIVQGEASESDDDTAPPGVQAVNKLTPPVPKRKVPVATVSKFGPILQCSLIKEPVRVHIRGSLVSCSGFVYFKSGN